ncbi:hypothetical protein Pfo_028878 [Paulownia fortunei]|nr:hypothetical protein Pfo_028878 [Paulownia fortunei]
MNRRTLTMDWDGLGVEDDDDSSFFDSYERLSSVVPLDLTSGSDEDEYFEDSRMSFVSAMSSASIKRIYSIEPTKSSSILPGYDMWMAKPGDVKERRKRLSQGVGLSSNKDLLRLATSKIVRKVSRKPEPDTEQVSTNKVDSSPTEESERDEPWPSREIVLVRSRSDGDIEAFSTKTKQRKEELIGPISKHRLTRTSSGQLVLGIGACQCSSAVRVSPKREKNRPSMPNNDVSQSVFSDGAFGSFFLIKNLDTGKDFIVKEYNEKGMWNKLNDVQTGKQLTMEEFEKSVGYSPVVKELMRRVSRNIRDDGGKGVATSVSGLFAEKEQENSSQVDQNVAKNTSQWVEAHQHGKSYKEFTALHLYQEIQAHEGPIWTIRFSSDARFLASAGEDRMIHVWEVQECEVMSTKQADDLSSASSTPVHPMASTISDRPPLAEITPIPSEMSRRNAKKGNSIPDYVNVPETVLALSEKPVCTFKGRKDDVLDLAWSKSQFNPVDEDYFISGSLDAKVRIWSIPDRQVVDWTDVHEMVTAACYAPDGQGAMIGCHRGSCRMYSIDGWSRHSIQKKKKSRAKKFPAFPSQAKKIPGSQSQAGKITGFQFAPWNPSEVLITSPTLELESTMVQASSKNLEVYMLLYMSGSFKLHEISKNLTQLPNSHRISEYQ